MGDNQNKSPMDLHQPLNMVNNVNGGEKPRDKPEDYQNGDGGQHEGGEYECEGGEFEGGLNENKNDGETDTQSKPPTTQTLGSST